MEGLTAILFSCLLFGLTWSAENIDNNRGNSNYAGAWNKDTEYKYTVRTRTLTALSDVADQWAGIVTRAELVIRPKEHNRLIARIVHAEYAQFNEILPHGWNTELHDSDAYYNRDSQSANLSVASEKGAVQLNYQSKPFHSRPFEIILKNGAIRKLSVDKSMTNDEANQLRGIVSQLQIDTQGQNLIKCKYNNPPQKDTDTPNGVYKTMEPTVTGVCETLYDVSTIPEYLIQSHTEWVPMPDLAENSLNGHSNARPGRFLQIVKTKNFSNCEQRMGYHHGLSEMNNFKPNTNLMDKFFSKSAHSNIVVSGNWERFTIQSAVTTNIISISAPLWSDQRAQVVSRVNLTLKNVKRNTEEPAGLVNPVMIDLTYSYNIASDRNNNIRQYNDSSPSSDSSSSSSSSSDSISDSSSDSSSSSSSSGSNDSSSSSSSSEENRSHQLNENKKRNQKTQNNKISSKLNQNTQHQGQKTSTRTRRSLNDGQKQQQPQLIREFKYDQNKNSKKSDTSSESSSSSSSDSSSSSFSRSSSSSSGSSHSSDSSSSSLDDSLSSEEYYQPRPTLEESPDMPLLAYFVGFKGKNIQESHNIKAEHDTVKLAQEVGDDLQRHSELPEANTLEKFTILSRLISTMNHKQLSLVSAQLYTPDETEINAHGEETQQQQQENQKISGQNRKFSIKNSAWQAYRDAVTEAGSGPAFSQIKEWIVSGKINGEQAAQLLARLPKSIRVPTDGLKQSFFDMVTSPVVQRQKYLNSTALFALTEFLNRAQVNNHSVNTYYPVQSFGPESFNKKNNIIERQVIPYLAHNLKAAVVEKDSYKVLVYIRAIGNLGHPSILNVFEPYLEGKYQISGFQRLAMVTALDKLVENYPKLARSVLYRMYQNIAETHEVRCASIFQLMRTSPSAQILQRMAESTQTDPSIHVRSAIQSAIISAATLSKNSPYYTDLSMNAQSAVKLLNSENYGAQYSTSSFRSYVMTEMNLVYKQQFSYIGSEDHLVPQALFYKIQKNMGGYRSSYNDYYAMVSSLSQLFNVVDGQFQTVQENNYQKLRQNQANKQNGRYGSGNENGKGYVNDEWSIEKLAKYMKIDQDIVEEVEGQILLKIFNTARVITLNNRTLSRIPQSIQQIAQQLSAGKAFNVTKFYNQEAFTIAFPMESGYPFIYSYKTPTLFRIGGEAHMRTNPDMATAAGYSNKDHRNSKANSYSNGNNYSHEQVKVPDTLNVTADINFVYSTMTDVKTGFITPFNHQRYIAGYQRKLQVNIPLRMRTNYDILNNEIVTEIRPLNTADYGSAARAQNQQGGKKKYEINILHLSNWPYTAIKDIGNMHPMSHSSVQSKLIMPSRYSRSSLSYKSFEQYEKSFGQQSTGMVFRLQTNHSVDFVDYAYLMKSLRSHDYISVFLYPLTASENNFNYHNINLYLDYEASASKSIKFTTSYNEAEYDQDYSQSDIKHYKQRHGHTSEYSENNLAQPSSTTPNSNRRQKQFLQNAGTGIKQSQTAVIDLAVEFNNGKSASENNAEYVFTTAYAYSPVDKRSRLISFLQASPMNLSNQFQACMTASSEFANAPEMSFWNALNYDSSSQIQMELLFGAKCQGGSQVSLKAKLQQSNEYKEYLKQSPMAKLCDEQMERRDNQLSACQNVTTRANLLDQYSVNVEYENLSTDVKQMTKSVYEYLKNWGFDHMTEEVVQRHESRSVRSGKSGKNNVKFDIDFSPELNFVNLTIQQSVYSEATTYFRNIPLNKWARVALVEHPDSDVIERVYNEAFGYQYNPTCTFGENSVNTFDNKTYNGGRLGNCWHIAMQYAGDYESNGAQLSNDYSKYQRKNMNTQYAILIRDTAHEQKEVVVILGQEDSNDYVIRLAPSTEGRNVHNAIRRSVPRSKDAQTPYVFTNGKQQEISENHAVELYTNDGKAQPLFRAYALPMGEVRVEIRNNLVSVTYDGENNVKITAGAGSIDQRNKVGGMCGTMNGDKNDDFISPNNCVLRNQNHFVASWAVAESTTCQSPAVRANHNDAKNAKCYDAVQFYYSNVINGYEARRRSLSQHKRYQNGTSSSSSSSDSSSDSSDPLSEEQKTQKMGNKCQTKHQIQYVEHNGELCFTKRALPACQSGCRAQGRVEKIVEVHCRDNKESVAQLLKQQVSKGANPDMSMKAVSKSLKFNVPQSCVRKQ